jgi:carbon-monoxide dehydrogenase catalytic subunit
MSPNYQSMDPAVVALQGIAEEACCPTVFDRAAELKPCPIGSTGVCCRMCGMGPCRLVGKTDRGVCGATRATVVARNYTRMVAGGVSAHSDHGRDLARTLIETARGEAQGYRIRDVQKLYEVAEIMEVPTKGRKVEEIAEDVGRKALAQFGQQEGELIYLRRAPKKRQEIWRKAGIAPRGIDREVVEAMHRTHEGVDMDAEHILMQALRCSLADGWGGSMMATDISDILFGTPVPLNTYHNLGVLKEDEVNLIIHGHEPTLSEMVVAVAQTPEMQEYARSKGAKGINLAGMCCTSLEVLARHGVPSAGNFLSQEIAVLTGAVDAMVVDVQCIMEALVPVSQRFHTLLITTSPKAKMTGALHIEFDEEHALDIAKEIVKRAVDNFPNRKAKVVIPKVVSPAIGGFSHEYLQYMQGGLHRGSFRPLNDAIIAGRIRGVAGVVGCNNARVPHDEGMMKVIRTLIANDVLVVTTGCTAHASGKYGYLLPEMMRDAGKGLREVCEAIGIPPVLNLGSCVDNSRILTVLSQMATEGGLGQDIGDLPAVGMAPEWMSEKAIAIGTYCAASGVHTIFGVNNIVSGSPEVVEILSKKWDEMLGGTMEFIPDYDEMIQAALAHIDRKRAELGLVPWDPERYGQSGGDELMEKILSLPPEQRYLYSRKVVEERVAEQV